MDDLTLMPRVTHDRGLWTTAALAALAAVVALALGAGFDLAGAPGWPVLDDLTHASGWIALAAWITALIRGAHRSGGDTAVRIEAHVQSVREELRAGRAELRQLRAENDELRKAIEALPDQIAKASDAGYWKAYNDGARDFGSGGQVLSMPRQGRP